MSTTNGSYVSRAELAAHLGPMKSDIREIRDDIKTFVSSSQNSSWLGDRGRALVNAVVPAVISGGAVYLIVGH
jgi:hypothetical protein